MEQAACYTFIRHCRRTITSEKQQLVN